MEQRYVCEQCYHLQLAPQSCQECGGATVDIEAAGENPELIEGLRQRVATRRRRYILAMEAMAVVFCAGILFVALAMARGLGGGALEWVAKLSVVGLLAGLWKAIPVIYGHYLQDVQSRLLGRLQDEE